MLSNHLGSPLTATMPRNTKLHVADRPQSLEMARRRTNYMKSSTLATENPSV